MASDDRDMAQFLAALGSNSPTPGGGAACAVVGALAAALAEMVAQFTVGKRAYAAADTAMREVIEQAQQVRQQLVALVEEDERGYGQVSAGYGMPKASDEERATRAAAIQAALPIAMQAPMQVMERGCAVVALALQVAEAGNTSLVSDAGCAALFGAAAVHAAGLNVLANVILMENAAAAQHAREQVAAYERQADVLSQQTMRIVNQRLGR